MKRPEFWIIFFLFSFLAVFFWDFLYLNERSFTLVYEAYVNSILTAIIAVLIIFSAAWFLSVLSSVNRFMNRLVHFLMNQGILLPQVLVILFGQAFLNLFIVSGEIAGSFEYMIYSSLILAFALLSESLTFFISRIELLKEKGFYEAMVSLNIKKWRIIHFDILWDNSRKLIITKAVSIFASVFFLQVIVDFIISVGLGRDLSQFNFPPGIGSLLADTSSKEDLLYVQHVLTNPSLFKNLFFRHLQGLSLVLLLFITLLSMVKYSSERLNRLRDS